MLLDQDSRSFPLTGLRSDSKGLTPISIVTVSTDRASHV